MNNTTARPCTSLQLLLPVDTGFPSPKNQQWLLRGFNTSQQPLLNGVISTIFQARTRHSMKNWTNRLPRPDLRQEKRHQRWHQFPLFMIHHITSGKLINNDYNQESAVSILKWSIGLSHVTMVLRPQACQPQRTFGMVTHVFFCDFTHFFTLCNTIFHNCFSHCKWPRTSNDPNDNWQSPNLNSKFVCWI